MGRISRYLPLTVLTGFTVVSAVSLWTLYRDATVTPEDSDVRAINETVVAAYRDGDALRPLPLWFKDARLGLDGVPMLLTDPLENNLDLPLYRRLFVSYVPAFDDALDETLAALDGVETLAETPRMRLLVGNVSLSYRALWDSTQAIRSADVGRIPFGEAESARIPCTRWLRDAWHCERFNEWLHVGVRNREIDDNPRRCIIANPREARESWSIRWDDVPLGDRVRLRFGYTMWALRASRGGDLHFRVFVDGVERYAHTLGIDDFGYEYVEIDVSDESADTGTIEARLYADDHFDRFFCFRLQTVEDLQAEVKPLRPRTSGP